MAWSTLILWLAVSSLFCFAIGTSVTSPGDGNGNSQLFLLFDDFRTNDHDLPRTLEHSLHSPRRNGDSQKTMSSITSHLNSGNGDDWCKFQLEGYLFDLCPLLVPERYPIDEARSSRGLLEREIVSGEYEALSNLVKRIVVRRETTASTVTYTHYHIALRGKLNMSSEWWKGRQCRDATWVCAVELEYTMKDEEETEEQLLKVISVAGNLRLQDGRYTRLNATMHLGPQQDTADHGELHLVLHGGIFEGKNQAALLRFLCDRTVREPSSITFSSAIDGLHVFAWASRHACATRIGDVLPT